MSTLSRLPGLAAIVLSVSALAAGCAPASAELSGMVFLSVDVADGGASRPLVRDTRIRLDFGDDTLNGNAGCNQFGYPYRIDGGRLVLGEGGMTAMGCDPDLEAQDMWLLALIASKPTITLVGSDLTLTSGAVVMTFRDREIVEPDAPLAGPRWTVDAIVTGDVVSSLPAGTSATVVFHDDGTVEVNAGCNIGSGTWTAVAGGIDVSPLMLTKRACQKDPAAVESAVLGVLEADPITASIDGPVLTLRAGNRGLMLRAA